MSTSRRLAKRSIIGTKVCAPGPDGLWYSGVIQDVKTPASMSGALAPPPDPMPPPTFLAPGDAQLNADTRYIVRFDFKTTVGVGDASESVIVETRRAAAAAAAAASGHLSPAQALRRNAMTKEFRESDLIGPGFRSIMSIQLQPGQRIFLTYNGREQSGDVVQHDVNKDEVVVKITTIGNEPQQQLRHSETTSNPHDFKVKHRWGIYRIARFRCPDVDVDADVDVDLDSDVDSDVDGNDDAANVVIEILFSIKIREQI
ncbi:hypothetical protein ACLKA6_012408 [Drosophila palustris]